MGLHRRGRIMLITGGTGFLGRHLISGAATADWEIIAPSSRSMDITHRDHTVDTIHGWKPDVVVHLAYRKGDRASIVDGTASVATGAAAANARLVHMSTDVVFPGRPRPYTEDDHPAPVIDYGRDKLDAERAVASITPDALIIRTSLIYGTDRPSPAQVELAGALRSPAQRHGLRFFTDEYRCPVHADDLARAVAELAARPEVTGLLHVTGPERVSRAAFAELMARHAGLSTVRIPTTTIAESGQTRPADIALDVSKAASLGITCRPVSAVLG